MPALGLLRRAVHASTDDTDKSKGADHEVDEILQPRTPGESAASQPTGATAAASAPRRRLPSFRVRSSSSTSLAPSLASTNATSATRRPHLSTKSSSLSSVSEPTTSLVHADPVMAKRKQEDDHPKDGRKGKAAERPLHVPPSFSQRSESEEALIKQLEVEGRGENMTLLTRSSGSSPVAQGVDPLPADAVYTMAADVIAEQDVDPSHSASTGKASLQERLQGVARQSENVNGLTSPRLTLGQPVRTTDFAPSRLRRMSSWIAPRIAGSSGSHPDGAPAEPTRRPEANVISEVTNSTSASSVPDSAPGGASAEVQSIKTAGRLPETLPAADVESEAAMRGAPPRYTAPATAGKGGWLSFLRATARPVTAGAEGPTESTDQPTATSPPVHEGIGHLAPGLDVLSSDALVSDISENTIAEAAPVAPAVSSASIASLTSETQPSPAAMSQANEVLAHSLQQQGWGECAKSWLVPVLPTRILQSVTNEVTPTSSSLDAGPTAKVHEVAAVAEGAIDNPPQGRSPSVKTDAARSSEDSGGANLSPDQKGINDKMADQSRMTLPNTLNGVPTQAEAVPAAKAAIARASRKDKVASVEAKGRPSLVLPTFEDTFERPPRTSKRKRDDPVSTANAPPAASVPPAGTVWKALGAVTSYVRPAPAVNTSSVSPQAVAKEAFDSEIDSYKQLPRLVDKQGADLWAGVRRVVVVGVHGWFPHKNVQILTGTPRSSAFFTATMGEAILSQFEADHGIAEAQLEKLTYIPLDGEGSIDARVDKLFKQYLSKPEWISDMRRADAVFFVAHSQGCIVTSHLVSRLIMQGHVRTPENAESVRRCEWAFGPIALPAHASKAARPPSDQPTVGSQRLLLLAMCGIHQGPFYSMTTLQPYLWFEGQATKELFEFQDTTSAVSADYQRSLGVLLDHGVKVLLVASLDDQMVPIYSAAFASASHPFLLRAIFVDSKTDAADDWMTHLMVLCMKLRNAGIDDQGLLGHLSEVTAGSMRGTGHSRPYEDANAYILAIRYLLATEATGDAVPSLQVEPFTVRDAKNDYEIPWILRGLMDSAEVRKLFQADLNALKEGVLDWKPATKALREIKQKLEPMAGRAALRSRASRLLKSPSSASLASSNGALSKEGSEGRPTPVGSPLAADLRKAPATGLSTDW